MSTNNNQLENRLWGAADELRANSKLKASEYSIPVLGLIFLRYADVKFAEAEKQIGKQGGRRRSTGGKERYQAMGVLYLPEAARFGNLLKLPEGENIGQAINDAMRAIEQENLDLKDVLPKTYNRLENATLVELLKLMGSIPMDKRYFYFLEDRQGEQLGLVVFDELERAQCHILIDQMSRYFRETAKGLARASLVIPEPFFVHSHLTTAVQIADIVAYLTAWGFRVGGMTRPAREELAELAAQVCDIRYQARREVNGNQDFAIWSFAVIDDLRPRGERDETREQ